MHPASSRAVFRPIAQQPALIAAGAAGLALLLALVLVARGLVDGITFAAFASYVVAVVLLAVAAVAGYWAVGLFNLRYEVGDGALTIVWGLTRQVVPLAAMERVVRGRTRGLPRVQGLELPGWDCHVGWGTVPRLGDVLFYSTHRTPADILYLVTANETYGLSPADAQGFIQALQRGLEAEPEAELRQEVVRHPLAALPAWSDRFGLATALVAAVLALAAVVVIFSRYTGVPAQALLPFPEEHTGSKRALLGIPASAIALLLVNVGGGLYLHRVLRPIAYTLLVGAVFVEALFLVAALIAT